MMKKIKTYIEEKAWEEKVIRQDREMRRWCFVFLAAVMTYFILEVICRVCKF
ncbi:hypothetical protein SMITH_212 [Smithella sp. ME-1]|uniref:Uncharacterized protein n=1 Tax=hydrocarbon metagenome TaxID=938273 RepID=A0A0W8FQM0_9ZZZZ|nr:hypothetical protein SMITH_212 [Smithella sp. ME-1]